MENTLKNICSFISQIVQLDQTIHKNKLSYAEVKALLTFVDVKGRGYLDLGDVYDLVGKVGEEELFAVFKFLDGRRNGEIRVQELQVAIGDCNSKSNQTNKEYIFPRFYAIVDTVKDRPKNITQAKSKLALSNQQLRDVYRHICDMVQSKYLTNDELVTVLKAQSMKYGWVWGGSHGTVVGELFGSQNVSQGKFIECLGQGLIREEVEEENLLSGIQEYHQKTQMRQERKSEKMTNPSTFTQNHSHNDSPSSSIIYTKLNNFDEPLQTPSFRVESSKKISNSHVNELDYPKCSRQMDKIEGNINEVLGSIQQRRERLRQDSMERKKIIEDVMNRKKDLCQFDRNKMVLSKENGEKWNRSGDNWNAKVDYKSYLNVGQGYRGNSSPKEPVYPEYQPQVRRQSAEQPVFGGGEFKNMPAAELYDSYSNLSPHKPTQIDRYSQHEGSNLYEPKMRQRPSTPTANLNSHQNMNINDILRKYNTNQGQKMDEDMGTLKQLCKSKSGLLYGQAPVGYKQLASSKYNTEMAESWEGKWQNKEEFTYNSRGRQISKENVMKRAEEEAARKIQEIQRKARMKVLEKKNILSRNQGRDWRGLAKKGIYY